MLSLKNGPYHIPAGDPDYGTEAYHQPATHDLTKGTGKNAMIMKEFAETK